jgi:hypothetical protein
MFIIVDIVWPVELDFSFRRTSLERQCQMRISMVAPKSDLTDGKVNMLDLFMRGYLILANKAKIQA